ncbi:MAG: diadenylate cyclase [Chitinispirillaceae bacterium]|nr:diadenylate cyclase [Chitinispirillaceae bacterium]
MWFQSFVSNVRFADLLDIAVITVLFYSILNWLQQRASRTLMLGMVLLALLYGVARFTNMYVTLLIYKAGFTAGLVILVIVFQEEVRRVIERLLFWRGLRTKHKVVASNNAIDILVQTIVNLAHDRIGALVVIKGRNPLERFLSGGISLSGRISLPLLYSIFHPETPGHDGAAIIEADRIEKFAVRLPLSRNIKEIGDRGTRHTAGLGLSEQTDALVLIVSEERGSISVAENGRMEQIDPQRLKPRIENFYARIFPATSNGKHRFRLTRNMVLKCASLGLALLVWLTFSFRTEIMNRTFTVPIEYRNIPPNWVIEAPTPAQVQVSLSGMERAFTFNPEKLVVSLNMSEPEKNTGTVIIKPENINIPSGLKLTQVIPQTISLRAYELKSTEVPVKLVTSGTVSKNLTVKQITLQPKTVKIFVPPSKDSDVPEIKTEPLLLKTIKGTTILKLKLIVPNQVRLEDKTVTSVKATVIVKERNNLSK